MDVRTNVSEGGSFLPQKSPNIRNGSCEIRDYRFYRACLLKSVIFYKKTGWGLRRSRRTAHSILGGCYAHKKPRAKCIRFHPAGLTNRFQRPVVITQHLWSQFVNTIFYSSSFSTIVICLKV